MLLNQISQAGLMISICGLLEDLEGICNHDSIAALRAHADSLDAQRQEQQRRRHAVHRLGAFDWRVAFYVVGLAGLPLALLVRLTVRELPRGASEAQPVDHEAVGFREVLGIVQGGAERSEMLGEAEDSAKVRDVRRVKRSHE